MSATAAQMLAETLVRHEVDRVFCVPGESYLALLDALLDRSEIEVVTCRHESGAGFMAVADGKITGRPGIALVSRGPGATNASIAVHTADQDAVPMVLFIGQVERKDRGRGALQEVDYETTFADMAKHVVEVSNPGVLCDAVAEAFRIALSGTPGPVIVSMPEDMLMDPAPAAADPLPVVAPALDRDAVAEAAERLAVAERPLIIAGAGVSGAEGRRLLAACADQWQVPVAVGFKRQDLIDNDHPCFAAHLGYGAPARILDTLAEADLIIAIGTRLGDVTTQGYRLPKAPRPDQPLVHIHPDAAQVGRVYDTDLGIVADAGAFLAALADRNAPSPPPARGEWIERVHAVHADMARWQARPAPKDGVDFGHVIMALAEALPGDAVIAGDAGNFNGWMHRYFPFRATNLLLGAVSGAMGLAVPAAVAAALRCPDRPVIGLIGDGGYLMTGNELATAVRHGAAVKLFVANNGSFGTIRLHQEKAYPGRVMGTDLVNPDFARLAEAFGALGLTIAEPADAEPVVAEALAHDGPVVVDVRSSLERISAFADLDDFRGN
jgi:acetolactate synthase-1/2/3 large subunit